MADGVDITAGSGTTVLTDDTGATGHAQVVKLAISTDGSPTLIPSDGTDGLLVNLGANNDVTVTGNVAVDLNAGTNNVGDVDIASIAAGDNNIGNVDIVTVPAPLSTTGGGTEATAHRVTIASDSTGVLSVDDNNSSLTVDQATASSLNAQVVGPTAADAAITGNPLTIGARASTAQPTAVSADGDVVNLWANRRGALVTAQAPHAALNGNPWTLTSTSAQYTTQQTSTALATVGAGTAIVVTSYQLQATGTTAGAVQLYFGTGAYSRGTTPAIFDGSFVPSATSYPGVVQTGVWIGASDADLRVTTSAAINSLTVTVWYYLVS